MNKQDQFEEFVDKVDELTHNSECLHWMKTTITKRKWKNVYENLQKDIWNKLEKIIRDFKRDFN